MFHVLSGVSAEPASDAEEAHERGHHHHHHASRPATLLLGSFMHSLVDGTGIAAAFAIVLLILIGIGAMSFMSTRKLVETSRMVGQSHDGLEKMQQILGLVMPSLG